MSHEPIQKHIWKNSEDLGQIQRYVCGHCGERVASQKGFGYVMNILQGLGPNNGMSRLIAICPKCEAPSYFSEFGQVPGPNVIPDVKHLPHSVDELFREVGRCVQVGAYTSAVLACRKLLMHIAVDLGAKEGQNFVTYVEYLYDNHYVPPSGKAWIDLIRAEGNEANHEIVFKDQKDAESLIGVLVHLLRSAYEFPGEIPAPGP